MNLARTFALLVASCCAFSNGCGAGEGAKQSAGGPAEACLACGNTVDEGGAAVRPPDCASACVSDDECVVVNVSCPGCCDPLAIHVAYQESYLREKARECEKYTGLVCGCDQPLPAARCVEHMCALAQ